MTLTDKYTVSFFREWISHSNITSTVKPMCDT